MKKGAGMQIQKKSPTQERSRETVKLILDTTAGILEKGGYDTLTTNKIAAAAGLSVASIYQYFPDKHGILCALFKEWLDWVHTALDLVKAEYYLKVPLDEFIQYIAGALFRNSFYSGRVENQLVRAMAASPEHRKLERAHARAVATRFASFLRGYGSPWPEAKLKKLCLVLYELNNMIYKLTEEQSPAERAQTVEWCMDMAGTLVGQAMKKPGNN